MLTGHAAAAMQPNGQFRLPDAPPAALRAAQVRQLMNVYAHAAGPWLQGFWEHDHGAPIDIAALHVCGRVFYARSVYHIAPGQEAGPTLRHYIGAHWLGTLCGARGDPEVSVALAANDTGLRIVQSVIVGFTGNDFFSGGMPADVRAVPPSPEEAAALVAHKTRRRITEVPELVQQPPPYAAQLAVWRIVLDAAITVRRVSDSTIVRDSVVYFGFGHVWHTTGLWAGGRHLPVLEMPDPTRRNAPVTVTLTDGYADRYDAITVVR